MAIELWNLWVSGAIALRDRNYWTINSIWTLELSTILIESVWWNFGIWKRDTWSGWWFGTCFIFPYIGNVIIPIDELIFFREVAQPPSSDFHRITEDPVWNPQFCWLVYPSPLHCAAGERPELCHREARVHVFFQADQAVNSGVQLIPILAGFEDVSNFYHIYWDQIRNDKPNWLLCCLFFCEG